MTTTITETLSERHKTHGNFRENASISQRLKLVMRDTKNWSKLKCDQREALEMIATKISRILSGDPHEPDHWHDVAGYAGLVEGEMG